MCLIQIIEDEILPKISLKKKEKKCNKLEEAIFLNAKILFEKTIFFNKL